MRESHTKTKNLTRAAALFAGLLVSGVSRAAVVSLPAESVAEMMRVPKHVPEHVSAGARVGGIFVVRDPATSGNEDQRQFQLFTSARDAAEFSAKGYVEYGDEAASPRPCVFVADDPSTAGEVWTAIATSTVRRSLQGPIGSPILGIHLETLHGDGTPGLPASLGIVDGWLDTRTRGFKLVGRSTVQLVTVAEGPAGIRVLAARGTDAVHLVVLPPAGSDAGFGIIQTGGEVGVSECRHLRVTLDAHAGTGEHADVTFQRSVLTPPEPGDTTSRRIPIGFDRTSQTELVQVHLSASRNANGSEPVVSVTFHVDPPKPVG